MLIRKENDGFAFGAFMAVYRSSANPFLVHFFDADKFRKQIHQHLGARINQITGKSLNSFKVLLPCLSEQKKIADCLSALDRKIGQVETQVSRTREIKQGLLQKMFV